MSWTSSSRKSRLPDNWVQVRVQVLKRDGYRCRLCNQPAFEVDHIDRGDNHELTNLRALCTTCHGKKSSAEGNHRQSQLRSRRLRPAGKHPGAL